MEQKGTTENGKIIRLVRSIDFTPNYWSEAKFRNETREMYEFKYDLSGCVTEYIIHNYEPDNTLYVSPSITTPEAKSMSRKPSNTTITPTFQKKTTRSP